MSSSFTSLETVSRNHGIVVSIGFMILLPIGVLIPRFFRTFTPRWWLAHWVVQFIVSGPMILVGWYLGHEASGKTPHGKSTGLHGGLGVFVIILYLGQVAIGAFIHFVKTPRLFGGRRPPQNYFHVFLGLLILALSAYQIHDGLYTEWPMATGNVHPVSQSIKTGWLVLLLVFWICYAAGLSLVPRQYKQEAKNRQSANPANEQIDLQYGNAPLSAPWSQEPRYNPI